MNIYEAAKECKRIADLSGIRVSFDGTNGKTVIDKYFYNGYVVFSLSAVVWKNSDFPDYVKFTAKIKSGIDFKIEKIKYRLLYEIYKYSIQKLF